MEASMTEKIEYWLSEENMLWYFRIVRLNGKLTVHSDGYSTKEQCLRGINVIMSDVGNIEPYEIESQINIIDESHIFNIEIGG
jgi:uncharacterized protein YegP (UPF0339 family)